MLEFPKSEQSTQNSGRSTRKSKMEQQFKLRNFWKSRHTFFWSLETGVRRQWNASKVTLLWILCVYCAYVFTKYVPQGGDTLLLYRKLLFLGVAVGVTLLHSFWTTSKALPKTFSLWTQKVHFSGQRNAPSGQLYFVHPTPLHHPTISIFPYIPSASLSLRCIYVKWYACVLLPFHIQDSWVLPIPSKKKVDPGNSKKNWGLSATFPLLHPPKKILYFYT